jgi:hypothetical protein
MNSYKCRYNYMHERGMVLPDDAFRDKAAGEGGHIKLWAVVDKVQEELVTAEQGYKEAMTTEQQQFQSVLASITNSVEKLTSFVVLDKVCPL